MATRKLTTNKLSIPEETKEKKKPQNKQSSNSIASAEEIHLFDKLYWGLLQRVDVFAKQHDFYRKVKKKLKKVREQLDLLTLSAVQFEELKMPDDWKLPLTFEEADKQRRESSMLKRLKDEGKPLPVERKKNPKTEAKKLVKRIDYFFAERQKKKRKYLIKLIYWNPKDKKRSKSVQVVVRNQQLARALKLTKRERECISLNRESPQGVEMKEDGDVLICVKSSSEDSEGVAVDIPVSPKKMVQGTTTSGDNSPIKTLQPSANLSLKPNLASPSPNKTLSLSPRKIVAPTSTEKQRDSKSKIQPVKTFTKVETTVKTAFSLDIKIKFSRRLDDNICFQLLSEYKFNKVQKLLDFQDVYLLIEELKEADTTKKENDRNQLFNEDLSFTDVQMVKTQTQGFTGLDLDVSKQSKTQVQFKNPEIKENMSELREQSLLRVDNSALGMEKQKSENTWSAKAGEVEEEKKTQIIKIPEDHEIWDSLVDRIQKYIQCFKDFCYIENQEYLRNASQLYQCLKDHFPSIPKSQPQQVKLLLLHYLTLVTIEANQFDDAINYVQQLKASITDKMMVDHKNRKDKIDEVLQLNMSYFCQMLLLKVKLRIMQGEYDGACKPLFKVNRLLLKKVLSKVDQEQFQLEFYQLMATHNSGRREYMNAYQYIRAALLLQNKISERKLAEFEAQKKKAAELLAKASNDTASISTQSKLKKVTLKKIITPAMLVKTSTIRKVKLEYNPFIHNPISLRLEHLRHLIIFSDYMQAERILLPLIKDIGDCTGNKYPVFQQKECTTFISLALYLLKKLKRFQDIIDFTESFLTNANIMEGCNPFSLYYILEIFRTDKKLSEIFQFESSTMKNLKQKYFAQRLRIKKMWLLNPCFLFYGHMDCSEVENKDKQEIAFNFIEAVSDNFIFMRAIQVEFKQNFKKFYKHRQALFKSSFEERVQLFLVKDQEDNSTLLDLWPR